jgi:hypothetical protein
MQDKRYSLVSRASPGALILKYVSGIGGRYIQLCDHIYETNVASVNSVPSSSLTSSPTLTLMVILGEYW